jgi:histidyl-tRNA synthetase
VLGEDELAAGMVKIKEMGLPEGHPDKNGVDVKLDELVEEVRKRITQQSLTSSPPTTEG